MDILIVVVSSALPTVLFFGLAAFEKRENTPSPLQVIGWTFLLGYTAKGMYLAWHLHSGAYHRLEYFGHEPIFLGLVATMLSVAAFLTAYLLTPETSIRTGLRLKAPDRLLATTAYRAIFVLSVALMAIFFWRMGFVDQVLSLRFVATKYFELQQGDYATSFGFLTIGGDFLLVFALYFLIFNKAPLRLNVFTVILAFLFLTYFLASRRNAVIIMLVAFLLVFGVRRAARQTSAVVRRVGMFAGMVVVLGLLSFSSQIRSGGGEKGLDDLSLGGAIETTFGHFLEGAYFMDPSKTGAVMMETRDRNLWQGGESYYMVLLAPIPREIWPEKPAVRNSYFVGDDLLDLRSGSGAPPSGIAELYMNFGWLGIVFGMAALGAITRLIYAKYLASPDKRFARVPYALSLLCIALFFLADFGMAILFFARYAIAMFVCSRYWQTRVAATA